MVDIRNMDSHLLAQTVQDYPWFAPARARLCLMVAATSGMEAAEGLLRESIPFLPDATCTARRMHSLTPRSFADKNMPAEPQKTAPASARPIIFRAGMDYFSREEYESVHVDGESELGRMAMVDYSVQPQETGTPRREESMDIVSETLAQIFIDQGYTEQAKDIYTKLSLQSPEKSAYFASLIDNLK